MNRNGYFCIKTGNLFIISYIRAILCSQYGEQVCVSDYPKPCSARPKTSRRSNLNIKKYKA